MKLTGIDTQLMATAEILKASILEKNQNIAELVQSGLTMDVLFIEHKFGNAVLKVSPEIRRVMVSQGHIFVDMMSVRVRDHFQPLQCFYCQDFGHNQGSSTCKAPAGTNVCMYCSKNHRSKDCQVKNLSLIKFMSVI